MSLADQFAGAVARAQFSDLNALAHKLWKAHAAGHIDDDQAQALAEQLEARKPKGQGRATSFRPASAGNAALASKRQRSPDKVASIARRRRLARASPVPPELVDQFTQGEHAVITVVAGEIARAGACTWCLDRVAAVAGVCKTLARAAIRKARNVGLLYSMERRRRGQKSLTNVVKVLRRSWGAWLQRIGCRKTRSTANTDSRIDRASAVESFGEERSRADRAAKESGGVGFARSVPRSDST
jgi:hypothetical protein